MGFYSKKQIDNIGFGQVGENVLISSLAQFYNPEKVFIKDNVRIDDFCILSAQEPITIGNNVHISAYCALYGKYGIELDDFSGLSARCTVYSSTDDFSGDSLVGPMVPDGLRKEFNGKVTLQKHVQVGANCVILPRTTLKKGSAVGALSLVNKDLESNKIYAGIPARIIKDRNIKMFELAEKYEKKSKA